jgi:uncharacterized protein involved in exopolysaccharide biosynthesis
MLISTFLVIRSIPDVYESRATIVVAGRQDDRQAIAARVAAVTERLTSREFLESLIQRHNLYPDAIASGVLEGAVFGMRRNITVDTKWRGDRPETVTLAYRNHDPSLAKAVAADLLATFGEVNQAIEKQLGDESKAIATELSEIEARLTAVAQKSATTAARRSAVSRVASTLSQIRNERSATADSLETLGDKQYALERQITEQKRLIGEQEKLAAVAVTDARQGGSYGVLSVRKAELEASLQDYTTQYKDKHPKVIQTRNQLSEIKKQMAELTAASSGAPSNSNEARELRSMQRELSKLETDLEVARRESSRKNRRLGSTPNFGSIATGGDFSGGTDGSMGVEYDSLKSRYTALLSREDSLRKLQLMAAGLDPGLFQIVDTPATPQLPSGPNRFKLQLLGLGLALFVGLLAAALIEGPRLFAIHDDRDVEYYLGTRVIALIPESFTPVERGRMRRLLLTRGVGVLLLLLALIPALFFLLNYSRVFQMIANR